MKTDKIERIRRYFRESASITDTILKFKSTDCSRQAIIEAIGDCIAISDKSIIEIFYRSGEIVPSSITYFKNGGRGTDFDRRVISYLTNRFLDSESMKETLTRIFYKRYERPLCAECHKNKVRFTANRHVFAKFCSKKCSRRNAESQEAYRRTLTGKYGNPNYNNSEKNKRTCLERYGKTNVFATDWCKEKIEQHWIESYGVRNPMQIQSIQDKAARTMTERYGSETYIHSDVGIEHVKRTMMERYGCQFTTQSPDLMKKVLTTRRATTFKEVISVDDYIEPMFDEKYYIAHHDEALPFRCKKCNRNFLHKLDLNVHYTNGEVETIARCPFCFPLLKGISYGEKDLLGYVRGITDCDVLWRTKMNRKILKGKEIDILIPEKKIGIEYNGLYWHSGKLAGENYHLNKTMQCENIGWTLVHIFQHEWENENEATRRMILGVLNGNVEHSGGDVIRINRSHYCKTIKIPGYNLVGETGPVKRYGTIRSQEFEYFDCGELIYERTE